MGSIDQAERGSQLSTELATCWSLESIGRPKSERAPGAVEQTGSRTTPPHRQASRSGYGRIDRPSYPAPIYLLESGLGPLGTSCLLSRSPAAEFHRPRGRSRLDDTGRGGRSARAPDHDDATGNLSASASSCSSSPRRAPGTSSRKAAQRTTRKRRSTSGSAAPGLLVHPAPPAMQCDARSTGRAREAPLGSYRTRAPSTRVPSQAAADARDGRPTRPPAKAMRLCERASEEARGSECETVTPWGGE